MEPGGHRWGRVHPYVFVAAVAVSTVLALFGFRAIVHERDAARFANATETVQDSIRSRLEAYLSILLATRSLFLSRREEVDVATFRSFVSNLELDRRYPGMQGVGFARRFEHAQSAALVDELRRQGHDGFRLWPEGQRDEQYAIVFLEPLDRRNRAALGFDMYTEETRRAAMAKARDTGLPAASGKVTLVQEIDPKKQAGFLIYAPVYAAGSDPRDLESRRRALVGFVYSPFRADDLMQGIFGSQREPRVAFYLYDGTEVDEERLMYRGAVAGDEDVEHVATAQLNVAGRTWTLKVESTRAFEAGSALRFLSQLALIGVFLNLAIFFAARAQLRSRREEEEATRRLATLAETSKRFSEAELELGVVLRTVCEEVANRLTESCTINLLDTGGRTLYLAETRHLDPAVEQGTRALFAKHVFKVGETSVGRVAETGEALFVPVVVPEPSLARARPELREYFERFPVKSLLIVPLRVGERIIGTMSAARGPGRAPYTARDQQLLQDIADRAAFAIENARLAERLRTSTVEAQQAVRLRDDFLSIAGHELRTPLAALQLQIEGVLRQTEKGSFGEVAPRLLDRLKKADAQVQRLGVLIAGLLDVSRIAAGRLALHPEQVELGELIADIVERFGEQLSRARCEISVEVKDRVTGEWDRMRLDQVFTNLLSNAIKYGPGKPIRVTIERRGSRAIVSVQDQGIGVPAEARDRIFGRFERAVSERNYGGLGLGLWISQQIVASHDGRIVLQSQLGEGSTFMVELPL